MSLPIGPRAPDHAQLTPCFYDWTVGLIPDLNCRVHASSVTIGNIEIIVNYYNQLEDIDRDCWCVSQALADQSA